MVSIIITLDTPLLEPIRSDGYGTSRQLTPIPLSRADADPRNVLHEDDPRILVAGSSLISRSSSLWKGQSEVSLAARNTLDSARIPRASKLLICGLFQKG